MKGRVISKDALYSQLVEYEKNIMAKLWKTPITINGDVNPDYVAISARLAEVSTIKHMIFDTEEIKCENCDLFGKDNCALNIFADKPKPHYFCYVWKKKRDKVDKT